MEYISKYLHLIVAGMLVLCLLPMPYGFYALVRLASAVAFAWWAYKYYQKEKMGMMVTCTCFTANIVMITLTIGKLLVQFLGIMLVININNGQDLQLLTLMGQFSYTILLAIIQMGIMTNN